jgi:hypothetical protein
MVATNSPTATPKQTEIELGITDGNSVEIISGISVWDMVLVSSTPARTWSGTTRTSTNSPNMLWWPGWDGGGGWWGGFR